MVVTLLEGNFAPDADARLWRYMDFAKFASLVLTKHLFLPRLTALDDPLEGTLAVPFVDRLRRTMLQGDSLTTIFTNRWGVPGDRIDMNEWAERAQQEIDRNYKTPTAFLNLLRPNYFVTSWFAGMHESVAMWRYFGEVAIQTSVAAFCGAVSHDHLTLGRVRYDGETFDEVGPIEVPALFKHPAYSAESEIRGVLFQAEPVESRGVTVPVRLEQLVEEIRISPFAPPHLSDSVEALCTLVGLKVTPRLSDLAKAR